MEAAAVSKPSGVRVDEGNPTIELHDPPSSSSKVTARSMENTDSSSSVSSDSLSSMKALRALASGAGAGIVTTLVCSPFDVAKVRIQVQGSISSPHSNYATNTLGVLKAIIREEGVRGFYAGLTPALLTVPLFWSIYWGSYTRLKDFFEDKLPPTVPIFVQHVFAAIGAGAAGDIITNPLWVTRTRMQTLIFHRGEYGLKGPSRAVTVETVEHAAASVIATNHGKKTTPAQMTTLRMMQTIYKQEGITAFYRGLGASFLGLTHVAIQFPLYEHLKKLARERRGGEESAMDLMGASMVAKYVASAISYPHEVLRSRMQDSRINGQGRRLKLFELIRHIAKTEGVLSLWSGFQVNCVRIVPATISTFLSYEYLTRYLEGR